MEKTEKMGENVPLILLCPPKILNFWMLNLAGYELTREI
jgi:hypothetical protein